MNIYLAGKMAGLSYEEMNEWRIKAKTWLKDAGFGILNPVESGISEESSTKEIVMNNKAMIMKSDIILAEFNNEDVSFGTIGEVVFSSGHQKPVITWGSHPIENPWIQEHVVKHFDELEEAVAYLISCYFF
jgi:nucleoside 2-deoxyribosyltransferase